MSTATEYFPFLKGHPGDAFWISLGVTIFLLILAAIIAIRGERAAEREGAKKRMIPLVGMIFFGIGFVGCAGWYFWPARNASGPIAALFPPIAKPEVKATEKQLLPDQANVRRAAILSKLRNNYPQRIMTSSLNI
jgi:hypothetical protein